MAAKKGNMFAALAVEDDGDSQPVTQVKKQQPEKKQEQKPRQQPREEAKKPRPVDSQPSEGFEQVNA